MTEAAPGGLARWRDPRRWKWHLLVYAAAWVALYVAKSLWLPGDWFFWLMLVWAAALLVHYLVVKTFSVDESWADARAADLRMRSYDIKHVSQVIDSAVDGDPETDPAAPRRGRPPPRGGR